MLNVINSLGKNKNSGVSEVTHSRARIPLALPLVPFSSNRLLTREPQFGAQIEMEWNNILGYPGWQTSPQAHVCCSPVSVEPVVPPERALLFHRRGGRHSVLGNEGAEQQHLPNLAVLVKDIITLSPSAVFSCHPSARGCCPHSISQGREHTARLAHTRVPNWSCCQLPLMGVSNSKNLHCSRRGADPDPQEAGGAELSLSALLVWLSLLCDNLQGQRRQALTHLPPADLPHETAIKNFLFLWTSSS